MIRITWDDGYSITTNLSKQEALKRMDRLSNLRVLMEGYDAGVGLGICKKALNAYNKQDNFTGIIRLTNTEKEFLSYCYMDEYGDIDDIEDMDEYAKCLLFYMGNYAVDYISLNEYRQIAAGY